MDIIGLMDPKQEPPAMKKVSAKDFKNQIGKYQDMALAEPITITKHDRPSLVLLSFDEYQKLTGNTRRSLHVSQLSDKDLEAIAKARVPAEYDHLNDEVED